MSKSELIEAAREFCYPSGKQAGDTDYPITRMADFTAKQIKTDRAALLGEIRERVRQMRALPRTVSVADAVLVLDVLQLLTEMEEQNDGK